MNGEEPVVSEMTDSSPLPAPAATEGQAADAPGPAEADAGESRIALRARLMERFAAWLDRMLADEPAPEGVPRELVEEVLAEGDGQNDLYALFSAMTALTGEIKLQGRSFKQLADAVGPVAHVPQAVGELAVAQRQAAGELEQLGEMIKLAQSDEAALPSGKETLAVILDLYDRLERGLRMFDAIAAELEDAPSGWLGRLVGGSHAKQAIAATHAMREGYELTLSRVEAAMEQWGLERIGEVGEMFDPERMTVTDVAASDEAEGSVLEVYRSGYAIHGRVLMTAQVKVAKGG